MGRLLSIAAAVLTSLPSAYAQQAQSVPRVGFISGLTPEAMHTRVQAFKQGLKELGYIEGRNIVVEYRWGRGKTGDALRPLVAELVALKPQAIVTAGPGLIRLMREASVSTPIVMAFAPDPVGSGFVRSLARPGANITGLTNLAPEVSAKQIDVLRQIIPQLSRICLLWDSKEPGNDRSRREIERAAHLIGAQVTHLDQREFRQVEDMFEGLHTRCDALMVLTNAAVVGRRPVLTRIAAKNRVPVMWPHADFVDDGGLVTYSANVEDLFRRSASYVDKILKGAKPGELPIEQPYKFDLVINLKAAKEIGLAIPMGVLTRADRVVQ